MQAALGWGSIPGGGTACSIRIPARSGLGGRLGGGDPAGEPRDFSPSSKLGSDVLAKIGNERRSDWQGRRQLRVSVLTRVIWQSGEVIRGEVPPSRPNSGWHGCGRCTQVIMEVAERPPVSLDCFRHAVCTPATAGAMQRKRGPGSARGVRGVWPFEKPTLFPLPDLGCSNGSAARVRCGH